MPMLATGKINKPIRIRAASYREDAGFTLVELMVVLLIIGLMASVVVLSLPTNSASLAEESETIAARLELAAQEALLTGTVVGVEFSDKGYRFLKRIPNQWAPYAPAGLNGWQSWPDATFLSFEYEGEAVDLAERKRESDAVGQPALYFLPTGETQNLSISLRRDGDERLIAIASDGVIQSANPDAFQGAY